MNRFTPNNQSVLDSADKPWPVNTWHPIPIPEGIEISATYPRSLAAGFWLVQAPLPPVPAVKTQYEMDFEAFEEWLKQDAFMINRNGMEYAYAFYAFRAACRYARQQMAPEGIV